MLVFNSKALLNIMLKRGVGVRETAVGAGISNSAVSSLLQGNRRCQIPIVSKLAAFFGVSPHELLVDESGDGNAAVQ